MIRFAFAIAVLALATKTFAAAADDDDADNNADDAEKSQEVEGVDKVEFHHNAGGGGPRVRDFRGTARGFMTAGWWAPGQMKDNHVSWKTPPVPEKKRTTFHFISSTSVLPDEMSRGRSRSCQFDGKDALSLTIGYNTDRTWKESSARGSRSGCGRS
jgi:hypothetical protein